MSNSALAQAVQPPQPMAHYSHFSKHVQQRLHAEDLKLKQPPSKRIKSCSSIVTSPDRLQGTGGPSPSAQETVNSQQGLEASPVQHSNDLASPVGNHPKSPGSKGPGKRTQPTGAANKRTARKSSTQTGRSTKPSHQIMAEVKAELAAAKAKREAEKLEQSQGGKANNTPSDPPPESNGKPSGEDAAKVAVAPGPENAMSQPDLSSMSASAAPAPSPIPSLSRPQTDLLESEKPPEILIEDLLKELSDSTSSGAQASTSTNTLDDESWRSFMADLKLPMGCEDVEGGRAGDDELLGSWFFDESLENSKDSPASAGDGGSGYDMMYIGPTMARFLDSKAAVSGVVAGMDDLNGPCPSFLKVIQDSMGV